MDASAFGCSVCDTPSPGFMLSGPIRGGCVEAPVIFDMVASAHGEVLYMRAAFLAILGLVLGLVFAISPAAAAQVGSAALFTPQSSGNWQVDFYANGTQIHPKYAVSIVPLNATALPQYEVQLWAQSATSYQGVVARMVEQDWKSLAATVYVPGGPAGATMLWYFAALGPSWNVATRRFAADPNLLNADTGLINANAAPLTTCQNDFICGHVYGTRFPTLGTYGMYRQLIFISLSSNLPECLWTWAWTDVSGYYSAYMYAASSQTVYSWVAYHGTMDGYYWPAQPLTASASFYWSGSGYVIHDFYPYDYNQTAESPVLRAWDTSGASYVKTQIQAQSSSSTTMQASKRLTSGQFSFGSLGFSVSSDWSYTTTTSTQFGPYTYAGSHEITFPNQYQDYFQDISGLFYSVSWCNQCQYANNMRGVTVSASDPITEAGAAQQYVSGNVQSGATIFLTASEVNPYLSQGQTYPLPTFSVSNGHSYSSSWQIGIGSYGTFTYGESVTSTNSIGFMVGGFVYAALPANNNIFVWTPKIQYGNPLDYHVYVGTFGSPYGNNFEIPDPWSSSVSGGSSFVADSLYGYSTQVSRSPTHSVQVGFTGGSPDGTDWGSVIDYHDYTTTRVNLITIYFYDHLNSHNGNTWDRLSAGVRMRLFN